MKNNFSTAGERLQDATFKEQSQKERQRERDTEVISSRCCLEKSEVFSCLVINYHTYSYTPREATVKLASSGGRALHVVSTVNQKLSYL